MSSAGDRERDRDVAGRPRNARPRDELGRPLPRGAAGVEGVPDDLALSPDETLTEAQRLLDAGRAFQAHEVLESTWKAAPGANVSYGGGWPNSPWASHTRGEVTQSGRWSS